MAGRSVTATHTGDHEGLVGGDEPLSSGGAPIDSFVLEYDTSPSFASQCVEGYRPGTMLGYLNSLFKCHDVGPLGRVEVSAASVDRTLGDVVYASPESTDAAQRSRLVLPVGAAADLEAGDFINVDGAHYQVKAVNGDAFFKSAAGERVNCPSEGTCLELTEDYAGRAVNASLPSLPVFGSKAVGAHFAHEVADLKPGVQYYFRVAARTKPAWSGDWRRSHVVAFEGKLKYQIRKAGGTEWPPRLGQPIFSAITASSALVKSPLRSGKLRALRIAASVSALVGPAALLAALRTAGVYSTSRCLALEITERWLRPKSAASARAFSMLRGAAALICSIILGV